MNAQSKPYDAQDKVLLVPATGGIHDYENYSAYICPPNRAFKPVSYLAFYYRNKIDKRVPQVLGYIDNLTLNTDSDKLDLSGLVPIATSREDLQRIFKTLVDKVKTQGDIQYFKESRKYIILTSEDDPRTVQMRQDIPNDKRSKKRGIPTPFAQSRRYLSLERLKIARTTSDLETV